VDGKVATYRGEWKSWDCREYSRCLKRWSIVEKGKLKAVRSIVVALRCGCGHRGREAETCGEQVVVM
jgi:hypothetical protein